MLENEEGDVGSDLLEKESYDQIGGSYPKMLWEVNSSAFETKAVFICKLCVKKPTALIVMVVYIRDFEAVRGFPVVRNDVLL